MSDAEKPLSGYRVIELAGIGPGPYAGRLLADMGADVVVVNRPSGSAISAADLPSVDQRGKSSIVVDLRKPGAAEIILRLIKDADVLIEGNRPGVTERLGVGPKDCHAVNPKLVYGRMTGWGQDGPWASMAGHDLNYLSITGALNAMGKASKPPTPPLNFVGDYGGGSLFLVNGILAALLKAEKTGKGEIVDAAIVDGVSSMMGIVYTMHAAGLWSPRRQSNLLDGAAPYYRCYETLDGKFMAIGCIEPQFFALMLSLLNIDPDEFGPQNNFKLWPAQQTTLEAIFRTKSRDEWAKLFDGQDACVTPVLDYLEAVEHPHNKARNSHQKSSKLVHPRPAPGFSGSTDKPELQLARSGSDTKSILMDAGFSEKDIKQWQADGVIQSSE